MKNHVEFHQLFCRTLLRPAYAMLLKTGWWNSNVQPSECQNHLQTKYNLHISIRQTQITFVSSLWNTLYVAPGTFDKNNKRAKLIREGNRFMVYLRKLGFRTVGWHNLKTWTFNLERSSSQSSVSYSIWHQVQFHRDWRNCSDSKNVMINCSSICSTDNKSWKQKYSK